jgi:hypothetical protein
MFKDAVYVFLVLLLLAVPAVVTSVHLAKSCNATLLDCAPDHGVLGQCNEMHYWEEIDCFKDAGFAGGYFIINARPAPARWAHFGPHGPGFPPAYGLPGRVFGWRLAAAPFLNLGVLAFASAAWRCLVRPTTGQLAAAVLVALTLWPCLLFVPATMQVCLHCALAFVMAGLAHPRVNDRGRAVWPFVALAAVALVRVTRAVVLVPWAAVAMAGEKRRGGVLVLAAVPALFLAWQYVTSPFPNPLANLLANLRQRPAAAIAEYLAHVDRSASTIVSRFAGSIATVYLPGTSASLRNAFALPLSMVARFQVAALVLAGAVASLRVLPSTRPLAAAVAGVLLALAVATGTQVPVVCAIAVAGCWSGGARANRPAALAATCAVVLGLVVVTRYDGHIRGMLGRPRVVGLYVMLLAGLCWVHRDTLAAVFRRVAGPAFAPRSYGRPYLFAWLNVAFVSALVVGLYDVKYDRDCRSSRGIYCCPCWCYCPGRCFASGSALRPSAGLLCPRRGYNSRRIWQATLWKIRSCPGRPRTASWRG